MKPTPYTGCASFTAWTTRVSNPVRSPRRRASVSGLGQSTAFASGVPPDLYAFHRSTRNSIDLSEPRVTVSTVASPHLTELSHGTSATTCARFTPSKSGQRLPPTYYRGCWHVVSRGLLVGYRHHRPPQKEFTTREPSSSTRRCSVRLAPIAENSLLLPPVGVWAVSQSQSG